MREGTLYQLISLPLFIVSNKTFNKETSQSANTKSNKGPLPSHHSKVLLFFKYWHLIYSVSKQNFLPFTENPWK